MDPSPPTGHCAFGSPLNKASTLDHVHMDLSSALGSDLVIQSELGPSSHGSPSQV